MGFSRPLRTTEHEQPNSLAPGLASFSPLRRWIGGVMETLEFLLVLHLG